MIKKIIFLLLLIAGTMALSACQGFLEDYSYKPPVTGTSPTSSNSY